MASGDVWFFGCIHGSGHGYHSAEEGRWTLSGPIPPSIIDGDSWQPAGHRQGEAKLSYHGAFTVLSASDYTVDSRGGSHATFVIEGHFGGDEAMMLARNAFPKVVERIGLRWPAGGDPVVED